MKNPINELYTIYTEKIALKARKSIVQKNWHKRDLLAEGVQDFKRLFQESLVYIRSQDCSIEDKQLFIESIFRGELRILIHEIIQVKQIPAYEAEDVCQDILTNLFKRLLSSTEDGESGLRKSKKEFQFIDDDYKSFVFYCLKIIKNHGNADYQTKIHFTVQEFS